MNDCNNLDYSYTLAGGIAGGDEMLKYILDKLPNCAFRLYPYDHIDMAVWTALSRAYLGNPYLQVLDWLSSTCKIKLADYANRTKNADFVEWLKKM